MGASKTQGIIALVIIIAIMAIVVYVITGFKSLPRIGANSGTSGYSTTIGTHNNSTGGYVTVLPELPCGNFFTAGINYSSNRSRSCEWTGGTLGLWAAAGNSSYLNISIRQNYSTYAAINVSASCESLYNYYNLSAGNYTVFVNEGPQRSNMSAIGGNCNASFVQMSSDLFYNGVSYNILNGNFSTGTYAGWKSTGTAFGDAPMNLSWANANGCYPEINQWNGYESNYFASTYSCNKTRISGIGNLTSDPFIVEKPFLNFQVISDGPRTSIEIIYNNKSAVTADFATHNVSSTGSGAFKVRNATLPLANVFGKSVRIKVNANESNESEFIVVGDFQLSDTPNVQQGILSNITFGST